MDSIPLAPLFGMYYQEMPEAHAYTHIAQLLNRLESYSEGLDDLYQLLCAYSASSPDVSPVSVSLFSFGAERIWTNRGIYSY